MYICRCTRQAYVFVDRCQPPSFPLPPPIRAEPSSRPSSDVAVGLQWNSTTGRMYGLRSLPIKAANRLSFFM